MTIHEQPFLCNQLMILPEKEFRHEHGNTIFRVLPSGQVEGKGKNGEWMPITESGKELFDMIENPSLVHTISNKLSQKEIELCQSIGGKWTSRSLTGWDSNDNIVRVFNTKPKTIFKIFNGEEIKFQYEADGYICKELAIFNAEFFPSMQPGDCICVADCLESGDNE